VETTTATVAAVAVGGRVHDFGVDAIISMVTEIAFDRWTLLVAGIVFLLLRFATRLAHTGSDRVTGVVRRAMPFLPEVLGVGIACFGGVPVVASEPVVLKVAVGLWASYVASKIHKVLGQTVLGDDQKLERALARRLAKKKETSDGEVVDRGAA